MHFADFSELSSRQAKQQAQNMSAMALETTDRTSVVCTTLHHIGTTTAISIAKQFKLYACDQDGGQIDTFVRHVKIFFDNNAENATVYITLEPCVHHGNTPPCVDALLQAKVDKVVVATQDPNPMVNGKGLEI